MIIYEQERSNKNHYIYHQNDVNLSFPIHMHNSFEFITVLDGEIEIAIEDKAYTLSPGDCTIIMPNKSHSYITRHYSKTYVCIFSIDYVNSFFKKTENLTPVSPIFKMENTNIIVNKLQAPENIFDLKSNLYKIVSEFYASTEFKVKENQNAFIHEVLSYIEKHFQENITLKSMADKLGYTYNYTSSLFNQVFKTSFPDFLNSCRISQSITLLLDSDYTISEIAIMCGYNSLRAFNRNFQKIKNTTPSEFRKNYNE